MIREDRAVSSAVTYSLVLGITLALTAGLVIGADSMVSAQRERAVQNQLDVIGQRVGSAVTAVDQLGATAEAPQSASVTLELPQRVAGKQYRLFLRPETTDSPRGDLYVAARDSDVNVTVPVNVRWADHLADSRVNGGTVEVVYRRHDPDDPGDDEVVIRSAT